MEIHWIFVFLSKNPHLIGFGTIETMDMIFNSITHTGNSLSLRTSELSQLLCLALNSFLCTLDDGVQLNSWTQQARIEVFFCLCIHSNQWERIYRINFSHTSAHSVSSKQSSNINVIWLLSHHYIVHKGNARCANVSTRRLWLIPNISVDPHFVCLHSFDKKFVIAECFDIAT